MFPELMLLALVIETVFSWPRWLYKLIRHPVVWLGRLISFLENKLNRNHYSHAMRYSLGALSSLTVIVTAIAAACLIKALLPETVWGFVMEALIASSLIASRSLYTHVAMVVSPLEEDDLETAREAISHIIGRDPAQLDSAGVARASLETLAENSSDGVIAPLFWGTLLGLPGLAAYKAINTLDSMIAYRNPRFSAFGGFAARMDDLANLIPARLTGALIALVSMKISTFSTMLRDAHCHRSLNAGWPESAMAGALEVRLSGPRIYEDRPSDEPWLNGQAPDPTANHLRSGLFLYIRTILLAAFILTILLSFKIL